MANEKKPTKVITGAARLSFANIFKPRSFEEGAEKYSATFIIPKSDEKTLKEIKEAIKAAAALGKEKFGSRWSPKKTPLRDGDTDEKRGDDPAYADAYFFNASSSEKPGVLDIDKTRTDSPEVVYSGCYVLASINFYPFSVRGNEGVAAGLNNILKVADGERLSGRASAEDDFADMEAVGGVESVEYIDDDDWILGEFK
jgi:hypothetical protein